MIRMNKLFNFFGLKGKAGEPGFREGNRRSFRGNAATAKSMGLGSAMWERNRARRKLMTTLGTFSFIFIVGLSTHFFKPMHEQEVDLLAEFHSYDAALDLEHLRNQEASQMEKYYNDGQYQEAIDFGLQHFESLPYLDLIVLGNSFQVLGRTDKAIIVYEKLSKSGYTRFEKFVEYKLAYLYIANADERGLERLEKIMEQKDHPYYDLACRLYHFKPTALLSNEMQNNRLLESFSID